MLKKAVNFSIIIIALFYSLAFGQSNDCDTIVFHCKEKYFDEYKFNMDDVYYYREKLYFKPNFIVRWFSSGSSSEGGDKAQCFLNNEELPYYRFYSGRRLIAEGNWEYEHFVGIYKRYYPNGKLKASGTYHSECKVGEWRFYNEKGELLLKKSYPKLCTSNPEQNYLGDTPPVDK